MIVVRSPQSAVRAAAFEVGGSHSLPAKAGSHKEKPETDRS
jgi:hypothetical protein